MAGQHDPYRALGVGRGASPDEIKKAHRRLAKRYHPDAAKGDSKRFLVVQEAYRVLSDPLLRREWDARHAPGPIRASASPRKAPTKRPERSTTARPARRKTAPAAATTADGPAGARPRSTRSYTWSASEVPWWEEGLRREAATRPSRRRATGAAGATEPAEERPAAPDFEVYNRSSGAAWSMAARAYFRKGDSDLPSRGVFRTQGASPLTAGKARAAAEAEARRAAAADNGRGAEARGGEVRPRRQDRP